MRQYCLTDKCRRQFLLKYFGFIYTTADAHNCCDNCVSACTCTECQTENDKSEDNVTSSATTVRSKKQQVHAKNMLLQYFSAENAIIKDELLPHLQTGLCDSLASTLSKYVEYADKKKLAEKFPHLIDTYRGNISKILTAVNSLSV
jgi:superfamily II DNA helicase RecQ